MATFYLDAHGSSSKTISGITIKVGISYMETMLNYYFKGYYKKRKFTLASADIQA